MTDIPQKLVDRVADALWDFTRIDEAREDTAVAVIAAMLDGVSLEWGEETPEESHAETAIGRYSIYCIMRGGFDDEWYQFLNGAGPGTSHETLDAAKAAVFAYYRARLLKAMTGQ